MKKKIAAKIKNMLLVTTGSLIYAVAISCFLDPNKIVPGGVSGIAIMVNHMVSWASTGMVIFALNVPLMIAALIKFGKKFVFSTVCSIMISSATVDLISTFAKDFLPLTNDLLLAALAGGALSAIGIGLVFKGGGTTGGSDILIKFIRLKYKHIKTGTVFMIVDSIVIISSAIVFRNIEIALYAAINLIVCTKLLDVVLYGSDEARIVYIVSDHSDEIAKRLMNELDVGVTYLEGEGAYTGQNKRVLFCAAHKRVFPKIRAIVTEVDDMAFMIVSSAQEIFGQGFKNYRANDL